MTRDLTDRCPLQGIGGMKESRAARGTWKSKLGGCPEERAFYVHMSKYLGFVDVIQFSQTSLCFNFASR